MTFCHSDPEKREALEDMYHQQRLSGASLASQRHTPDNLGGANFGRTIKEERPLSLAEVVTHTQAMWKLQTDDNFNATLREDFFFEQVGIYNSIELLKLWTLKHGYGYPIRINYIEG